LGWDVLDALLAGSFEREVLPALTPIALDQKHPLPDLPAGSVGLFVRFRQPSKRRTGVVLVPPLLPRSTLPEGRHGACKAKRSGHGQARQGNRTAGRRARLRALPHGERRKCAALPRLQAQPRRGRCLQHLRNGGGRAGAVFAFDASVSMQQYEEAMNMLTSDGQTLQKTMIEQLFVSRTVLNRRAKALKVTYDVFIYGLALSLAAFDFVLVRQ
jgi:hypothetical protein